MVVRVLIQKRFCISGYLGRIDRRDLCGLRNVSILGILHAGEIATRTPGATIGSGAQTGDNLHVGLYIVLFFLSSMILLFQKINKKKL